MNLKVKLLEVSMHMDLKPSPIQSRAIIPFFQREMSLVKHNQELERQEP